MIVSEKFLDHPSVSSERNNMDEQSQFDASVCVLRALCTVCTLPNVIHVLFSGGLPSMTFIYKKAIIYANTYINNGNKYRQILQSEPFQNSQSHHVNTIENFPALLLTFNVLLLFNFWHFFPFPPQMFEQRWHSFFSKHIKVAWFKRNTSLNKDNFYETQIILLIICLVIDKVRNQWHYMYVEKTNIGLVLLIRTYSLKLNFVLAVFLKLSQISLKNDTWIISCNSKWSFI